MAEPINAAEPEISVEVPVAVQEPVIAEAPKETPKVTIVTAAPASSDFVTETVTPNVAERTPVPASEDEPMHAEAPAA